MRMKDLSVDIRIRSLTWWLGRVLLLEQRILDERSSTLFDLLHAYMSEALQQFGTSEQVQSYWEVDLHDGESLAIVSLLHLEAGIMEYAYGRVDPCRSVLFDFYFSFYYDRFCLYYFVCNVNGRSASLYVTYESCLSLLYVPVYSPVTLRIF